MNPRGLIHALSAMIAVGFTELDSKQNELIDSWKLMEAEIKKIRIIRISVHFFMIHYI